MYKKLEWIEWYHELERYYAQNGNIDISVKYITEEGLKLGQWLSTQRSAYTNKKLSQEQIRLLNDLKIIWNKHSESWDTYYYALEEYYMKNGNVDISVGYITEEGLKLGRWISVQRYKENVGNRITKDQVKMLNDLGMIWDKQLDNWDTYYYALEEYYNKNGNINIPIKYETEDGLRLGLWLRNQRQAHRDGATRGYGITEDHIQLLEDLGINWDHRAEKWDTYYYALEDYYNNYGNIDVPRNYETEDGIKLGSWLHTQRQSYIGKSTTKITRNKIQILNDLNVDWNTKTTKLLNTKITKENKDKYYMVLNDRMNHVLDDISYEVSNEITKDNQEEIGKQIIKRIWK